MIPAFTALAICPENPASLTLGSAKLCTSFEPPLWESCVAASSYLAGQLCKARFCAELPSTSTSSMIATEELRAALRYQLESVLPSQTARNVGFAQIATFAKSVLRPGYTANDRCNAA